MASKTGQLGSRWFTAFEERSSRRARSREPKPMQSLSDGLHWNVITAHNAKEYGDGTDRRNTTKEHNEGLQQRNISKNYIEAQLLYVKKAATDRHLPERVNLHLLSNLIAELCSCALSLRSGRLRRLATASQILITEKSVWERRVLT